MVLNQYHGNFRLKKKSKACVILSLYNGLDLIWILTIMTVYTK